MYQMEFLEMDWNDFFLNFFPIVLYVVWILKIKLWTLFNLF